MSVVEGGSCTHSAVFLCHNDTISPLSDFITGVLHLLRFKSICELDHFPKIFIGFALGV